MFAGKRFLRYFLEKEWRKDKYFKVNMTKISNVSSTGVVTYKFKVKQCQKQKNSYFSINCELSQTWKTLKLLFFREYEPKHNKLLNRNTATGKKSSDAVIKLNDAKKNKSTELYVNYAPPYCITEIKHVNRIIIGNLNINSFPNRFDQLIEIVWKGIIKLCSSKTFLVFTETKFDNTFPTS